MVHVDQPDNDGFTFSVALVDPLGWIEIIERRDYHLRVGSSSMPLHRGHDLWNLSLKSVCDI